MINKGGVIIDMALTAGIVGFPYHGAYGAAKAGIIGLTKTPWPLNMLTGILE